MRTAAMSSTSASGLVFILLSVAVVQTQSEWNVTYPSTQICALKGSSVQISSSYSCPSKIHDRDTEIQKTFWFVEKFVDLETQPEFKDRVQNNCVQTKCTLTISDLRENDSAEYKFRIITNQERGAWFGSPGVNLTVTEHPDLQVHVKGSSSCRSLACVHADLECQSRCHLPDHSSYIWFKNRRKIQKQTSPTYSGIIYPADTISCAVKGYERFSILPVFPPTHPSVPVSPSGQIVQSSSVTLTCSNDANPPVTIYTWYKKNRNGDQQLMSGKNQFVFESINLSDSGQYYCEVENSLFKWKSNIIHLDVKALPSVSVSPSGQIVQGSSVTLTCSSDANPSVTNYTWYKEDQVLSKVSGQNFTISNIRSEHSGNYSCEVEDSGGRRKSASHQIVVSGSSRSVAVAFGVLLPLILLCALILFKIKRTSMNSSEPEVTPDSSGQRPSSQGQSEEQDNVHYVAVNFSQNQEDPIYCNTGAAQHHRHKKEQMFTEYAAVKLSNTSKDQRTELQGTEEDPDLLYSTVNKPQ